MDATVFRTSPVIHRYPGNPVLSAKDVPYHATLVFNAGVTKYQGRYVMIFRNDYGDEKDKTLAGHNMGLASSDDGIRWEAAPKPIYDDESHPLCRAYDPRLTVLDGRLYLCYALNRHGTCGGVAVTDDLERWEVLSVSVPDNRNMAIFPERFGGKIVRLERPFAGYLRPGDRFDIWISASADGRFWGESELVLSTTRVPWVNNKIGPAAPPVRTPKGWLAFFHGVDIDPSRTGWGWRGNWTKRYSAGLMLLDLANPYRLIGLAEGPVLVPEPEYEYEAKGYRDYVIFPGGMILEPDGEVKLYYGAADTVECLATAQVDDLLALCKPV